MPDDMYEWIMKFTYGERWKMYEYWHKVRDRIKYIFESKMDCWHEDCYRARIEMRAKEIEAEDK